MKKIRTIILFSLLALMVACAPKGIIPKRKMARINADMFLLDQYAGADREMRRFTDTAALYKGLFRSYGCTAEQYSASIDYYLNNTRDMEKILDMTEDILVKRQGKIMKRIEKASKKQDSLPQANPERKSRPREEFPPVEELKKDNN